MIAIVPLVTETFGGNSSIEVTGVLLYSKLFKVQIIALYGCGLHSFSAPPQEVLHCNSNDQLTISCHTFYSVYHK